MCFTSVLVICCDSRAFFQPVCSRVLQTDLTWNCVKPARSQQQPGPNIKFTRTQHPQKAVLWGQRKNLSPLLKPLRIQTLWGRVTQTVYKRAQQHLHLLSNWRTFQDSNDILILIYQLRSLPIPFITPTCCCHERKCCPTDSKIYRKSFLP